MKRLELDLYPENIPVDVEAFIVDAQGAMEAFERNHPAARISSFVAANPYYVYSALERLAMERGSERRFCELGSGFGVAAGLAAMLGFESTGVEREPLLLSEARQLIEKHGLRATFHQASYQPKGFFSDDIDPDMMSSEPIFSPSKYDLIYAYPWPAEYQPMLWMLNRFSRPGTDILLFRGGKTLEYWRKTD